MNEFRPPNYWNFFDDAPEGAKVKHVMRYNANPAECYKDGRIQKITENLMRIAYDLKGYEQAKWNIIRKKSVEIFIDMERKKRLASQD